MALPIKQLDLVLDNRTSVVIKHHHKNITSSKIRLQELHYQRNHLKQYKSNYIFNDKDKQQFPYDLPINQENIVMMISSITNPQHVQLSPIKKYVINKQKNCNSQSGQKEDNDPQKLRIKSIKIKIEEQYLPCPKKLEESGNVCSKKPDDQVNKSKIMREKQSDSPLKRNQLSANLSIIKTRVKSFAQDKKLPNVQPESRIIERIKLPQLKEQKHYPMIIKQPDQLRHIRSQSFILIQYPSERVVVSQKANLSLQIASLTKIMTFYTVIHIAAVNNIHLDKETLKVTKNVENISGTSAQLIEDQEYSIQQLLYGLMLPSGNDAANQLAYWGGNIVQPSSDYRARMKTFVGQMNRLSKVLNLKNTKFANPHGLPHVDGKSTSCDIAKLCCACMKIDLFRKIVSCRTYKCVVSDGKHKRQVQWQNTNKLLRREGFIGLKTGITVTAGPCLAAAYQFRDKTYISVVLRAPKISSRFRQTRQLIHWALSKIFKQSLSQYERLILKRLKRSNPQLDSDYSQDEHEFKYDKGGSTQLKKRAKILKYQL